MISTKDLTKIINYYWDPNKSTFSPRDIPSDFKEESKTFIRGKYLYRGRQGKQAKLDKLEIALTGRYQYSSREDIDSWTYNFENGRRHGRKSIVMRIPKNKVSVVASMDLAVQMLYTVPNMDEEFVQDVMERYISEKEIIIEGFTREFQLHDMIVLFTKQEVEQIQKKGSKSSDFIFHSSDDDMFQLFYVDPRKLKVDGKEPFSTDVDIIDNLKLLYQKQKVYPPVIDEKMNILDGVHRVIACKEMHQSRMIVLKRVEVLDFPGR